MIVRFDDRDYDFDIDDIDVRQAMVIKVKTGFNLLEWQAALEQADVDAIKALYWLMLSQNGIASDIDQVNFKILKFTKAFKEASENEATTVNPTKGTATTGSARTSKS